MLKAKLRWIYSLRKNIQCLILLCFGVYTPTEYALSCKIQKFYIYANQKKSKYNLGTPMLIAKLLWIFSIRNNIQCLILLCFGVYTPTQCSLSCKIPKFYFYVNRKKSKCYLGIPMLKENGSEYSVFEKINNALFYPVLEYIHQVSMLSHIKYRNSNFTRIEKS